MKNKNRKNRKNNLALTMGTALLAIIMLAGAMPFTAGALEEESGGTPEAASTIAPELDENLSGGEKDAEETEAPAAEGGEEGGSVILAGESSSEEEEASAFTYSPQPQSPEELLSQLEGDKLPMWEFAVDEGWLPQGWTQEEFINGEEGTKYWQPVPQLVKAASFGIGTLSMEIDSQEKLQNAINNAAKGEVIVISSDIAISKPLTIPSGGEVTIKSPDESTIYTLYTTEANAGKYQIYLENNTLSLENINIDGKGLGSGIYGAYPSNSVLKLNNVIIENCQFSGVEIFRGDVYMNSCISRNNGWYGLRLENGYNGSPKTVPYECIITDCEFTGNLTRGVYIRETKLECRGSIMSNNQKGGLWLYNLYSHYYTDVAKYFTSIIDNCEIKDNWQGENGSVGLRLYLDYNYVKISNTTISGHKNSSNNEGGGVLIQTSKDIQEGNDPVFNESPLISMYNVTITNNSTFGDGGGIYIKSSSRNSFDSLENVPILYMEKCTVSNNTAGRMGGGVFVDDNDLGTSYAEMKNCFFTGNKAKNGGAFFITLSGNATHYWRFAQSFYQCEISGNTAEENGGAICSDKINYGFPEYDCEMIGTTVKNNKAGNNGGGIYCAWLCTINLDSSNFNNNTAGNDGGAVFACDDMELHIKNSSGFADNTAENDGGGICFKGVTERGGSNRYKFMVSASKFTGNKALNGSGGAVYLDSTAPSSFSYVYAEIFDNSEFSENKAALDGGAIYLGAWRLELKNGFDLNKNYAGRHGGAIYTKNYDVLAVSGGAFSENKAGSGASYMDIYNQISLMKTHSNKVKSLSSLSEPFVWGSAAPADIDSIYAYNDYDINYDNSKITDSPVINDVYSYESTVEGSCLNGSVIITLTWPDNSVSRQIIPSGTSKWGFRLPDGKALPVGSTVKVSQREYGKNESLPAQAIIIGPEPAKVFYHYLNGQTSQAAVEIGEAVQAPQNSPGSEGHLHFGWWTKNGGNEWGSRYYFNSSDKIPMEMRGKELHFYEREAIGSYNVTYYASEENSSDFQSRLCVYRSAVPYLEPNTTLEGYTFEGWLIKGTNTRWNFAADKMPGKDLDLVAIWEPIPAAVIPTPEPTPAATPTPGRVTPTLRPSPSPTPDASPEPTPEPSASTEADAGGTAPQPSISPTSGPGGGDAGGDDSGAGDVSNMDIDNVGGSGTPRSVNMFGNDVPLGSITGKGGGWSLFNLFVSLAAFASACFCFAAALKYAKEERLLKNQYAHNEESPDEDAEFLVSASELGESKKTRKIGKAIAAVFGLLPVVLFLLLEDFSSIQIFNMWTPLISAVGIGHIAMCVVSSIKKKDKRAYGEEEKKAL